jgi:glycosyltransferase involved in cell wall biosynthesis
LVVTREKRLSICYVVLGHNLLTSAGPTRNVLYLAEALSQWADVTVAFRRVVEPFTPHGYKVIEVAPAADDVLYGVDDAAVRGMSGRQFLAYLSTVRRFVETHRQAYDVVLEKSWLLSGYLTALCRRHGLPAVVVENIVRVWNEPVQGLRGLLKYGRHGLVQALAGRFLRQAPLLIAETEELQLALTQRWRIPMARIKVVGLGVNRRLFRPLEQAEARRHLEMSSQATVLLYAGVLDTTHDLLPAIEAMGMVSAPTLQLHIVGDGVRRQIYESLARSGRSNVFFHGRVPHTAVPQYIAAADLCLAPYDPAAFPNGQVAYSTLKIPEYMASARPVVSVPSGHVRKLIQHGISGFLFPHDAAHWADFLRHCPPRQQLKQMGLVAASATSVQSWEDVAQTYLTLCEQVVMQTTNSRPPCWSSIRHGVGNKA